MRLRHSAMAFRRMAGHGAAGSHQAGRCRGRSGPGPSYFPSHPARSRTAGQPRSVLSSQPKITGVWSRPASRGLGPRRSPFSSMANSSSGPAGTGGAAEREAS
jgi:hypothetical protein